MESLLLGCACTVVAAVLYQIWDASLRTPLERGPDGYLAAVYVRNTLEHGWWSWNPDLAAPFGAQFLDLPHGAEHAQFLSLKVLGALLGGDVGLTINVYYMLGFGVTAVVAHLVLRHLGFAAVVAAAIAVAYTFLPYHFAHGSTHLWRSVYPNAPAIVLLVLWASAPRHAFLRDPGRRSSSWRVAWRTNLRAGRVAAAVALVALIGSWETMAVAFGAVLLAALGPIVALRQRSWFPVAVSSALAAGVLAVALVNMLPTMLHLADEGTNGVAARRQLHESEVFGLKLSRLVLPEPGHRWAPFDELGRRASEDSPFPGEDGQSLGLLGAAGFIAACTVGIGWGLVRCERPLGDRRQLAGSAGSGVLVCVLFGTAGGFSLLLGMIGLSQVRVWNRIAILIAFLSLILVAIGLERSMKWLRARGGRGAVAVAMVGLMAVVLWDTAAPRVPDYGRIIAEDEALRGFVRAIEARFDDGAAIFQYPVVPFPENPPVNGMQDYDHFAPYLQSRSLRWSYGAMKGRPAGEWQAALATMSVAEALPVLAGMSFSGVWVDRAGYPDSGTAIVDDLSAHVGPPAESGRYAFFDLRPWIDEVPLDADALQELARQRLSVSPPP